MSKQIMQQALFALREYGEPVFAVSKAIAALEQELAKPEQDLDVGIDITEHGVQLLIRRKNKIIKSEFYAAPPKREWQGLTSEELDEINGSPMRLEHSGLVKFARDIENKLREKNG